LHTLGCGLVTVCITVYTSAEGASGAEIQKWKWVFSFRLSLVNQSQQTGLSDQSEQIMLLERMGLERDWTLDRTVLDTVKDVRCIL